MKTNFFLLTTIFAMFLFVGCETYQHEEKESYPYDADAIITISEVHYYWCWDVMEGDFDKAFILVDSKDYSDFGAMTEVMQGDLSDGFREYYSFSNVQVVAFEVDMEGRLVGAFVKGNYQFYQYYENGENTYSGIFYSVVLNNAYSPQNDWKLNLFKENDVPSWWLNETGSGLLSKGKSKIRML